MKILFLCTLNAVRSPMAEAMAKEFYPEHQFSSAGLVTGPVDYFAVEVMQEIGLDISNHEPRSFSRLKSKSFDLVICLANEYSPEIRDLMDKHKLKHKFWSNIPSPGDVGSNRLMKLYGYREIRDSIKAHLRSANAFSKD